MHGFEPHHVWTPGPTDARRIARGATLLVVRRPSWIVITVLCVLLAAALVATGSAWKAPYLLILLMPAALPLIVYVMTARATRRSFATGRPWASNFGPSTMTITSPAGRTTLNYADMTDIRSHGPYVTLSMRTAGKVSSFAELIPPPAVDYLRSRIG